MKNNIKPIGKCLLIEVDEERALIVGDLHLGFEQSLVKSGIFVSREMLKEVLDDLDKIFKEIGGKVDRVILLGDVKHDFGGISRQEWGDISKLFDYLSKKCKKLTVIKGNHDNMLEPIAEKSGIKLKDYFLWKNFCFMHGDSDFEEIWKKKEIDHLVIGHGHPALLLQDGIKREKYKCFLMGKFRKKKLIVLPSFSEWYAGGDPREGGVVLAWDVNFSNFDVFVVAEDSLEALNFGKLKNIK